MKATPVLLATGVISTATMLVPGQAWAALDENLDAGTVAFGIFLLLVAIIYELPAIIAFVRRHPNRWVILVLCTALGGTGIVWLGCLVWAFMAIHISKDPDGSNGGQSGLNLLANDVQRVRVENQVTTPRPTSSADPIERLERLKKLLDDGAIDRGQFERMRDLITNAPN